MIIGITGGSGSGKSTVSALFREHGWFVIDADEVAHAVMGKGSACLAEVCEAFGQDVLQKDGELDRKKLGAIVFADSKKRKRLNKITLHYIVQAIKEQLCGKKNAVIDAPLLFESGLNLLCDETIFVSCPKQIRIKRIMERDGIGEAYAKARISSQKSDEELRALCDREVINDGQTNLEKQLGGYFIA